MYVCSYTSVFGFILSLNPEGVNNFEARASQSCWMVTESGKAGALFGAIGGILERF
jgi:hypothetical protein